MYVSILKAPSDGLGTLHIVELLYGQSEKLQVELQAMSSSLSHEPRRTSYTYAYTYTHVYIHMCVYTCTNIYICTYVYVCATYWYTHILVCSESQGKKTDGPIGSQL